MKYQRNLCTYVQRWVGRFSQTHTHVYRVGGLVKNVMILSIHTLWMDPILFDKNEQNYRFKCGVMCDNQPLSHLSTFHAVTYKPHEGRRHTIGLCRRTHEI